MISLRKIIFLFLILIPFSVKAISASSYIVMDQDSGRVLEGSNIDKESLIASISKIMTCIVALEYGHLDDIVEVDNTILKAYGSGVYIQVGEELTLDDLLYGLMLRSGNDAALMIAKYVAGDVSSFVYLMNEKALELGMSHTKFVNPSGLEENDGTANQSTVYDMALLTRYAMQNENYKRIVGTKTITVKSSYKTYMWVNKNKLLSSYSACTGGKTGFTQKARRTLVTTASKDGMSLVVVTFNDGNDFNDHKNLYEKYFSSYERKLILRKEDDYGENVYLKNDYYLLSKEDDAITTKIEMEELDNKVDGEIVGRVYVYLNEKEVGFRYLFYEAPSVTKDKSFLSKLLNNLLFWR